MNIAKFIWNRLRLLNRFPYSEPLFYYLMNVVYKDGSVNKLRRGPARGLRWRHYRCFQPWMAMGLYEPEVANLIRESLRPGDIFYDIGANAGYFVLVAAESVGGNGKVFAFDPVPMHVAAIQEQITLNKLDTICKVIPLAISDHIGEVDFLLPDRCANAHLLEISAPHIDNKHKGKVIQVFSTTLDSFISENPMPTLIKMDIEGAEVIALNGANKLLSSPQPPKLIITAHSNNLGLQVEKILTEHGYKILTKDPSIHAIPS